MAPKKNSGWTRIEKSWLTELLPVRVKTMLSAKFWRKNSIDVKQVPSWDKGRPKEGG